MTEVVVVCAAALSGSDQCPMDCRKCWYGGDIAVQWSYEGQGYVQYYPNREAVEQEFEDLKDQWLSEGGDAVRAKMEALKGWIDNQSIVELARATKHLAPKEPLDWGLW